MRGGVVRSPGVGRVLEVLVAAGATVAPGDEVVVIESMKVEIPVVVAVGGRVEEVVVGAGDQVQAGDVLIRVA